MVMTVVDRETTIFVVDDEAVRDSLAALLEATGLTAMTFATGRDFLTAYRAGRPPGCLVLDL
ncbi:MAG TPA: DNA-binding response regulator, partial [Geminicoccaceae bacterium]|nr:DNA-binding response regulator [Geminicoccaceae bacterium]